jgi:hypothetical protein
MLKGLVAMLGTSAHVKNEKQYEALRDKVVSNERAGKKSGSGGDSSQGGVMAQKRAGRKGGKAAHR